MKKNDKYNNIFYLKIVFALCFLAITGFVSTGVYLLAFALLLIINFFTVIFLEYIDEEIKGIKDNVNKESSDKKDV